MDKKSKKNEDRGFGTVGSDLLNQIKNPHIYAEYQQGGEKDTKEKWISDALRKLKLRE